MKLNITKITIYFLIVFATPFHSFVQQKSLAEASKTFYHFLKNKFEICNAGLWKDKICKSQCC